MDQTEFISNLCSFMDYLAGLLSEGSQIIIDTDYFDPFHNLHNYVSTKNNNKDGDNNLKNSFYGLVYPHIHEIIEQNFTFLNNGLILKWEPILSNGFEYYFDISDFWRMVIGVSRNRDSFLSKFLLVCAAACDKYRVTLLSVSNSYYVRSDGDINSNIDMVNKLVGTVQNVLKSTGNDIGNDMTTNVKDLLSEVITPISSGDVGFGNTSSVLQKVFSSGAFNKIINSVSKKDDTDDESDS